MYNEIIKSFERRTYGVITANPKKKIRHDFYVLNDRYALWKERDRVEMRDGRDIRTYGGGI